MSSVLYVPKLLVLRLSDGSQRRGRRGRQLRKRPVPKRHPSIRWMTHSGRRLLLALAVLSAPVHRAASQEITPNPGSASAPHHRTGHSVPFEITHPVDLLPVAGLGTVSFGYDGFGRRVRKSTPSGTTLYLNLGDQLVAEYTPSGTILRSYMYYPGVDRPFAIQAASNSYYYLDDGRGNVTGLIDAINLNQVVARYSYTPFGEELTSSGTVFNPVRFAGRELDSETGFYYNRARYYHPRYGRFLSEDPIGLAGGVNPYLYAGADPMNSSDPSGLFSCTITDRLAWHGFADEGAGQESLPRIYSGVSVPRMSAGDRGLVPVGVELGEPRYKEPG